MSCLARTTSIVAGILVSLSAISARPHSFHRGQTKEATGSISGRVTIGGIPARGVTVLLSPIESGPIERPIAKATSDQDGRFHLTAVRAGQHLLQAFAPALVGPGDNFRTRSGNVINISAGENIEGENLALTRGAAITGRVIDADGQPIILERVRLFAVADHGRAVQVYPIYGSFSTQSTDDRGIYRLFGIPAGRYILAVGIDPALPGSSTISSSGSTYYPLTYHPDAAEQSKATVIEVSAGSEATGVDIVIGRASKAYSASGRIIDADTGRPIVAMQYGISTLNAEGRAVYSTSSSASTSGAMGEFRIAGLAPGQYAAYAVPGADNETYSDTTRFIVSDADVAGVEVKVRRGSTIIGNVVIEGAEDQRDAPRLSDVRVGISSGSMNVAPRGGLLTIAPDGSFRAAGLPRGVANFSVFTYPSNKGLTLLRVERDGVEQKNGIEIHHAEEITGVKVIFGHGTGAIRGQVLIEGGELPTGAMMLLTLRPLGVVKHQGRMPQAPDARGRFAIDGLLPGEYEVSLTVQARPAAGSAQMNPKFAKQTVTVTSGVESQITMVVNLNEKNQ